MLPLFAHVNSVRAAPLSAQEISLSSNPLWHIPPRFMHEEARRTLKKNAGKSPVGIPNPDPKPNQRRPRAPEPISLPFLLRY